MKTINIDTGEEILKPQQRKANSQEQRLIMAVGILWANLVKKETELEDTELPLRNLAIPIKKVLFRHNFKYQDFEELFKDWFKNSKEEKANFFFCLSEQNIAKYILAKKKKDRPTTLANLADEIIL
jgi:hypothetical protein